jgi:hypothetical protein
MNINKLLTDITHQQKWRNHSQKCYNYYDGEQIDDKTQADYDKIGKKFFPQNRVKPIVNSVLGNEVQNRTDWQTTGDKEHTDAIEAVNQKLNENMRLCNANDKCSEAYLHQIVGGLGWIRVAENHEIGNKYKIEVINSEEVYYDMRAKDSLLQDARWIARRKMVDIDEATALFPEHEKIIKHQVNNFATWDTVDDSIAGIFTQFSSVIDKSQIVDSQRQRIALYEVYYKKSIQVEIIENDGVQLPFDEQNIEHIIYKQQNGSQIKIYNKMQKCWFIGAKQVYDTCSDLPHNDFPFVPFFGYIKNKDRTPYGIVSDMIATQDKYNRASSDIQHALRSKTIVKDSDATPHMTDEELSVEAHRADGIINKKQGAELSIQQNWNELQTHQVLLSQAENDFRSVSGIYQAFSGEASNQQSGVAIASLAELGSQAIAVINSNYQSSRKKVGELLLAHILDEIKDKEMDVVIQATNDNNKKMVRLNSVDENGEPLNVLSNIKLGLSLSSIKNTTSYREQRLTRMIDLMSILPDDKKGVLLPMVLEYTDAPNKEKVIEQLTGGNVSKEEQNAQTQQQMRLQQSQIDLEMQYKQVDILEKQAEAEKKKAEAMYKLAQVEQIKKENNNKANMINNL